MTVLFTGSYVTILDSNGSPVSGAKCHFYEAGTSTPITTYSDSGLSTANANPVVADASGRLGTIFLAADDYKVYITDADDVEIDTQDDFAVQSLATFTSKRTLNAQTGTSYTILTTDRSKLVTFSNASAIAVTLPQADSTNFPDGWYAEVKNKGAGTATITPTTSTIDGKATLTLPTGYGATIYSDGTNYQIQGFYRLDPSTNAQTGTTYTIVTGDRGKLITTSNASAIAVTLPQANATTFESGWRCKLRNKGAGAATITPTTSTINGQASIVLGTGQGVEIVSDGTNYDIVHTTGDEGTSAQILTSNGAGVLPTFQDLASGWTRLTTQTASSDTSIDFTSSIDSTYVTYAVVASNIVIATDSQDLQFRASTDGGSSYLAGTNYTYQLDKVTAGTSTLTENSSGGAQMSITKTQGNAATESCSFVLYLFDPASTATHKGVRSQSFWLDPGSVAALGDMAGAVKTTSAVDAIRFISSSGNITSGRFTLYGIKHT